MDPYPQRGVSLKCMSREGLRERRGRALSPVPASPAFLTRSLKLVEFSRTRIGTSIRRTRGGGLALTSSTTPNGYQVSTHPLSLSQEQDASPSAPLLHFYFCFCLQLSLGANAKKPNHSSTRPCLYQLWPRPRGEGTEQTQGTKVRTERGCSVREVSRQVPGEFLPGRGHR